jgi:hypothetical protein
MFGAEKWADAFDDLHRQNMKDINRGLQGWVDDQFQSHGEGWQFYGAAGVAAATEALYSFVSGTMGGGMVDVLRLGEGVKKGTAWGVLQDGLRVLSVAGGVLRFLRITRAFAVGGGPNSCVITSATKAMRLSGNKIFASLAEVG